MRNKCIKCGANVLEGNLCWKHKNKSPLKRSKIPSKSPVSKVNVAKNTQMKDFFLDIWKERPHYSEISQQFLGNEPKTLYFHHIILKSDKKYREVGRYDRENIILLTADEHQMVHLDMYKYEEINKRRELLLIKYNKS